MLDDPARKRTLSLFYFLVEKSLLLGGGPRRDGRASEQCLLLDQIQRSTSRSSGSCHCIAWLCRPARSPAARYHPVEVPPPSKPQRVCCLPLRSTQSPSSPRKPTYTMCVSCARSSGRGSRRSATGGRGALDTCRHSLRIFLFP